MFTNKYLFLWIMIVFSHYMFSMVSVRQAITQCGNLTCFNYGKCMTNGSRCMCHRGYKGTTCDEDIDECSLGDPCLHRGHCHNSFGSYRCACLLGWTGDRSHCSFRDNSPIHQCTSTWMGNLCQDRCLNNSMCRQNEVCKKHGRGLQCICGNGWNGMNCTNDIDECATNPCQNRTDCVNTLGSYYCQCISGWEGKKCDTDIDECLVNPCQPSSTCMNIQGSYRCECTSGWKGVHCDEDIDDCTSSPCNASFHCENLPGTFLCKDKSTSREEMSGRMVTYVIVGSSLGGILLVLSVAVIVFVAMKYKW